VYTGLSVVVLLVILSPLTFLAGVVLITLSTIAIIFRAFKRRPWKRRAIVTIIAVLPTLAAGSISNTYYGIPFSGGKAQLSEEEQRYIDQVGGIQETMKHRLDDNARILKKYPSIPLQEREQVYDHYFSDQDLNEMAEEKVEVPSGCEDHYEVWLEDMDKATATLYEDITLLDAIFTTRAPQHRTATKELREDTDASFEEADQLLNQIRIKGCER